MRLWAGSRTSQWSGAARANKGETGHHGGVSRHEPYLSFKFPHWLPTPERSLTHPQIYRFCGSHIFLQSRSSCSQFLPAPLRRSPGCCHLSQPGHLQFCFLPVHVPGAPAWLFSRHASMETPLSLPVFARYRGIICRLILASLHGLHVLHHGPSRRGITFHQTPPIARRTVSITCRHDVLQVARQLFLTHCCRIPIKNGSCLSLDAWEAASHTHLLPVTHLLPAVTHYVERIPFAPSYGWGHLNLRMSSPAVQRGKLPPPTSCSHRIKLEHASRLAFQDLYPLEKESHKPDPGPR